MRSRTTTDFEAFELLVSTTIPSKCFKSFGKAHERRKHGVFIGHTIEHVSAMCMPSAHAHIISVVGKGRQQAHASASVVLLSGIQNKLMSIATLSDNQDQMGAGFSSQSGSSLL